MAAWKIPPAGAVLLSNPLAIPKQRRISAGRGQRNRITSGRGLSRILTQANIRGNFCSQQNQRLWTGLTGSTGFVSGFDPVHPVILSIKDIFCLSRYIYHILTIKSGAPTFPMQPQANLENPSGWRCPPPCSARHPEAAPHIHREGAGGTG